MQRRGDGGLDSERERCTGGEVESVLGLPWTIRYSSALAREAGREALPDNISGFLVTIGPVRLQLRGVSRTRPCLYERTISALMTLTRTRQSYLDRYTMGLWSLTRETFNLVGGSGCRESCPKTGTLTGTLSSEPEQRIVIGEPDKWVASVGDSFISGEGGRWAGNTSELGPEAVQPDATTYFDNEEGTAERIPGCHRSRSAEIDIGNGVAPLNLACSGAKTTTFTEGGKFKPGLDFEESSQLVQLREFAKEDWVRMVAISIGGNDFGFGTIVRECVVDFVFFRTRRCSTQPELTALIEEAAVVERTIAIRDAIRRVDLAMTEAGYGREDFTLVVQDYPSVLPPSARIRYASEEGGGGRAFPGRCPFFNVDANWADEQVLPRINGAVLEAAQEAMTLIPNLVVMRVEAAFYDEAKGRRLCETGVGTLDEMSLESWMNPAAPDVTEWVTQVRLEPPYLQEEAVHPNYWAQLALRNCLREAYDGGAPREGRCTLGAGGLNELEEPQMVFTP
jgi:hypothetical protein